MLHYVYHVVVGHEPTHYLLAPQLGSIDVFLHFLSKSSQHFVVEAVDFRERQVRRESGPPGHVLDMGSHLQPSKVILTYMYICIGTLISLTKTTFH